MLAPVRRSGSWPPWMIWNGFVSWALSLRMSGMVRPRTSQWAVLPSSRSVERRVVEMRMYLPGVKPERAM